jgi:L-seryl-tRNA(Ser) seleniumtransferase
MSERTSAGPAAPGPRPPSVERLLAAARPRLGEERSLGAVVTAARAVVEEERTRLRSGGVPAPIDSLAARLADRLAGAVAPPPVVLNATGVVIHTNLGRAPWPRAAIEAAEAAAGGYLALELDAVTGRRGRRFRAAEEALIELTGAEDALVTNNNAAALALAVGLAGRGRGVVVSRGELVEIGGGVRIPEIVRRAGARLVEVGTTNRTRTADFEEALADGRVTMVLRVHPSNFRQSGFVESPDARAVAAAAHAHGAIVVDDLGSGALLDTAALGLAHEPLPGERLAAGADLVTFSGDKLLGGPQAGLVVGRDDLVARLRRDPLARATRPDKVTLAALAATLGLYRSGTAMEEIPVWRMLARPAEAIRARADAVAAALAGASEEAMPLEGAPARIGVVPVESTVGGGSLPGETLPSWAVSIAGPSPSRLLAALRVGRPAVIGRIAGDAVLLDLRTVEPGDDPGLTEALATAVRQALAAAR